MALKEHYYTKLEEGNFYHVYNRAVDRKSMFTENRNYYFFLTRIVKYLIPFVDVYAFCLLSNHFHLLLKVKELQKDSATLKELPNLRLPNLVSGAFRKMFQSYALAFNKQENRIGTLFQEPYKRSLVDTEEYLIKMIHYIHFNPQKHGLVNDFRSYPYSSYQYYLNKTPGHWTHKALFDLLGGYEGFIQFHKSFMDDPGKKYFIEDE